MEAFRIDRTTAQKEVIRDAFRNFDFVLGKVLEIYIAKRHNIEYHTGRDRELLERYSTKVDGLRVEWGGKIKNGVELYLRIKEILDGI